MELRDCYADLGVAKTATHDEIKQAYRRLALQHHPDKKAPGEDVDAAEFRKVRVSALCTLRRLLTKCA